MSPDGRARDVEDVDPLDQPPHPCMMLVGHYDDEDCPEEFTMHTRGDDAELVTKWITVPASEPVRLEGMR